jgi:hypothetical protein
MIKVISAAIKLENEKVISISKPKRHHDLLHEIIKKNKIEQGFLLNNGTFVDRKSAAKIVLENKQIEKLNWPPNLYTEDLW